MSTEKNLIITYYGTKQHSYKPNYLHIRTYMGSLLNLFIARTYPLFALSDFYVAHIDIFDTFTNQIFSSKG